ncbi:30S ribosomal protein S8 [Candidatus Saccharibacteria bacterium]|jgi:small subunit ribosomal protein S8|nr:30S ribosomal protein S8 [Candidatus Saccharibacteria bacterium]MCR4753025.1 30S ribosomal protein S8 [Candidatus Saccharibacteria bacterium]
MSIQTTDPVADLLTRIRNAIAVGKTEIRVPTSKLKFAVADKLQKINYLEKVEIEEAQPRGILHIVINNEGENARINEISKVSTPGRRIYTGVNEIPKVKSGRGTVLISTSKGIMTGQEAVKNKLGGEILVRVW